MARPEPVAKPGLFRKLGQIYRVDWDRTVARRLAARRAVIGQDGHGRTVVSYVKAYNVVARLTEADRMSADEVAEFGRLTQTCLMCGLVLENPESVARGIGPICLKKV